MFETQFNKVFGESNSSKPRKRHAKKPSKRQTFFYCNECEDVTEHAFDGQCKSCFQYNPEAMD